MRRFLREDLVWIVLPLIGLPVAWAAWRLYVWYTAPEGFCGYVIF